LKYAQIVNCAALCNAPCAAIAGVSASATKTPRLADAAAPYWIKTAVPAIAAGRAMSTPATDDAGCTGDAPITNR
jgi:hypothetical protein